MKKKGKELMELYKSYLSHKKEINVSERMTEEGILIEEETPPRIGRAGGKEETV